MPKPIPKPPRAEEVLAAVAARYPAGATVTLPAIAEACGVSEGTAVQVRRWARSVGRWPYEDGEGCPAQSGQADRPAAADGGGLVVDPGRGSSSRSATIAARPSAGQGCPSGRGQARFVARGRAGPPRSERMIGRGLEQGLLPTIRVGRNRHVPPLYYGCTAVMTEP